MLIALQPTCAQNCPSNLVHAYPAGLTPLIQALLGARAENDDLVTDAMAPQMHEQADIRALKPMLRIHQHERISTTTHPPRGKRFHAASRWPSLGAAPSGRPPVTPQPFIVLVRPGRLETCAFRALGLPKRARERAECCGAVEEERRCGGAVAVGIFKLRDSGRDGDLVVVQGGGREGEEAGLIGSKPHIVACCPPRYHRCVEDRPPERGSFT
ncbi:hypothetical protein KC361_g242 [Hortaea werneckii]|nr:hypothetical protein KC361_g242 [Hortaea werneckii]